MSSAAKRPRALILPIAEELLRVFAPGCHRLEIAGSLRRETKDVGDIELVGIPKVEDVSARSEGLLFPSSATIPVNRLWELLDVVAGRAYTLCGPKYRQFVRHVEGGPPIKVDVFTATRDNWGWIYLMRTGPPAFSHYVALSLNRAGYTSKDGDIYVAYKDPATGKLVPSGDPVITETEQSVFELARIHPRLPTQRN